MKAEPVSRFLRPLALPAAILAMAGCATTTPSEPQPLAVVSSEGSAALTRSATYSWFIDPATDTATGILNNNSQFAPAIQAAIERELAARGFRKATAGTNPDFRLAALSLNRDSESQIVGDYYFGGLGLSDIEPRYLAPALGAGSETFTVVLDARSSVSNALFWRGSVTSEVDRTATPEQRHARLNTFVDDLMAGFPTTGG